MENGANLNFAAEEGSTPLHVTCNTDTCYFEVMKHLVNEGADIDWKGHSGRTAFYYACEHGHLETAKFLVEEGADLNSEIRGEDKIYDGTTPIFVASMFGHVDVAKWFVEEKHVNVNSGSSGDGRTPLYAAAGQGRLAVRRLSFVRAWRVIFRLSSVF